MFTSKSKNLPVVLQCNGASGGLIVHRVCASNHAHKLLQHHDVITATARKQQQEETKTRCTVMNF